MPNQSSRSRHIFVLALALLVWTALFGLRLLSGVTYKTLAWMMISALLFWPLVFTRWSLWVGAALLAVVGAVDIVYNYHFHSFADAFLMATVFRTEPVEVADYFRTLPVQPLVTSALWLVFCVVAGWFLGRTIPGIVRRSRVLRWSWIPSVAGFLALGTLGIAGNEDQQIFVQDKMLSIYPAHFLLAVTQQRALNDAAMYQPVLPEIPPGTRINTVVAILGESASAARWSLLGYKPNKTNRALTDVQGVAVIPVLAQGLATVQGLPFMLTGRSNEDSILHRAPSFLDLAKRAGYKIFVFDNSRSLGEGDFFGRVLRRSSHVYRKIGKGEPGDVLTAPLQAALKDPSPFKLIVLHTFGSHEPVEGRYPADFSPFDDHYDNSIAYTSQMLKQWIGLLDSHGGSGFLAYTSDHGLVLPPCSAEYVHGRSLSSLEVPFLAWSNAAALKQVPELHPTRIKGSHSNVIFFESLVRAVGYGASLGQTGWPSSLQPQFENMSWPQLRSLNACSLT